MVWCECVGHGGMWEATRSGAGQAKRARLVRYTEALLQLSCWAWRCSETPPGSSPPNGISFRQIIAYEPRFDKKETRPHLLGVTMLLNSSRVQSPKWFIATRCRPGCAFQPWMNRRLSWNTWWVGGWVGRQVKKAKGLRRDWVCVCGWVGFRVNVRQGRGHPEGLRQSDWPAYQCSLSTTRVQLAAHLISLFQLV